MVSVGVSKLGYTNLIFVDPGVKVNGAYYHDVLLSQQLLPAIRQVSGVNLWVGPLNRLARQCLSAHAQGARGVQPPSARDSCIHLARFMSPNNPDHSPDDYQIWGISDCESRHKCTGCGRFEAASDWCLDWYSTKRYLRCHWVTQASA